MTDNAMILHDNSNAMSVYQEREDVRELGDRLMAMHPAAAEVGANSMRAAAQLALLLGANPLPGVNEVHIWKDSKGRNCMSLGINYWRRKAQEWGGVLYQTQPRPMNAKELTEYSIPAGTIAAICRGARADDMMRYKQMGFTTNEIWDMCGRIGIATQQPNEYAMNGRPNIWTSLKRAETDMLRQLFPAEFGNVERQTIDRGAPIVTIVDSNEDAPVVENPRYTINDFNADFGLGSNPPAIAEAEESEEAEYEDAPTDTATDERFLIDRVERVYIDGTPVHVNLHTLYDTYLAEHNGYAPEGVAHLMKWKGQREKNGNGKPAPVDAPPTQSPLIDGMEPEPQAGAFSE